MGTSSETMVITNLFPSFRTFTVGNQPTAPMTLSGALAPARMLRVRGKLTVGVLCLHGTAANEKVLRPFFWELRCCTQLGVGPKEIKLE